jgi:hypothetical protein
LHRLELNFWHSVELDMCAKTSVWCWAKDCGWRKCRQWAGRREVMLRIFARGAFGSAAFTLSRVPPPGNSSARPVDISMCDALWSLNPPRKAAGVCMRVSGYVQARKMLFLLSQHHHPAPRLQPFPFPERIRN